MELRTLPETPDPKQFYKQAIFDTVYNVFKAEAIRDGCPRMKLIEIYNKTMNRSYELNILSPVCDKLLGQHLHAIRSKAARQKFLRKHLKKVSREQAREQAIECILYMNEEMLNFIHQVTDVVIRVIADRVQAGQPEPDVDDFEDQYSHLINDPCT